MRSSTEVSGVHNKNLYFGWHISAINFDNLVKPQPFLPMSKICKPTSIDFFAKKTDLIRLSS